MTEVEAKPRPVPPQGQSSWKKCLRVIGGVIAEANMQHGANTRDAKPPGVKERTGAEWRT